LVKRLAVQSHSIGDDGRIFEVGQAGLDGDLEARRSWLMGGLPGKGELGLSWY
jgi:hypothetical protein